MVERDEEGGMSDLRSMAKLRPVALAGAPIAMKRSRKHMAMENCASPI